MNRAHNVVLLALLCLSAVAVEAQEWRGPASIAIEVKGKPVGNVEGALVIMRYQQIEPPGGPRPVLTDSAGRAVLADLAPGVWEVEVSHDDYLSFVALVLLDGRRKPTVQASFLQASGSSLTPIRVKFMDGRGKTPSASVPLPPEAAARLAQRRPPAPPQAPATTQETPRAPAGRSTTPQSVVVPEHELRPLPETARPADPPSPLGKPAAPEPEPEAKQPEVAPAQPSPEAEAPPAAKPERQMPAVPRPEPTAPEPELMTAEPPLAEAPEPEPEAAPESEPAPPMADPVSQPAMPEPTSESPGSESPIPEATDPEPEPEPMRPAPEPAPAPAMPERTEIPEPEPPPAAPEPTTSPPLESAPPAPQPTEPPISEPEPAMPIEPDPNMPTPEAEAVPPIAEPAPPLPEATSEPAPEAKASEPAPPPPPSPISVMPAPGPLGPTLRAYRDRTCVECRPGEWAISVEVIAGAAVVPCADPLDANGRELAGLLGGSIALELKEVAAPASEAAAMMGSSEPSARVTELLGDDSSSCRVVAAVIPKAGRVRGMRMEAADGSGIGDCQADRPCPVGRAHWLGQPRVYREPSSNVVWALFVNEAPDRARRARLTVYFAAPNRAWEPPR